MAAPRSRCAAVVLAGGAGKRLHADENKAYLAVAGRPLLAWSLAAFDASPRIDEIVLVIREADAERAAQVLAEHPVAKLTHVVHGGATRHASEHAGIEALAPAIEADRLALACVHDAARPFVRERLIADVLRAAAEAGGALPALPVDAPVLLRVDDDGPVGLVSAEDLRRVQTPQAFRAPELLAAYRRATAEGFAGVDTAASVARYSGLEVRVVPGDPDNIKVTFVEDLFAVEGLAAAWSG